MEVLSAIKKNLSKDVENTKSNIIQKINKFSDLIVLNIYSNNRIELDKINKVFEKKYILEFVNFMNENFKQTFNDISYSWIYSYKENDNSRYIRITAFFLSYYL